MGSNLKHNNMTRLKTFLAAALLATGMEAGAQNFDDYFVDQTLRIDYNFAGNVNEQHIAVDELKMMPRWYGKRKRLAELPMEGNAAAYTFREGETVQIDIRY